ncbi:MAG: trypsin-like peptidase domain-containing protein [Halobacteriovoraceae bacterium]|nr:trypsin-like peptidase domain-containing protein [Halobacteriovoraceae bacterium]
MIFKFRLILLIVFIYTISNGMYALPLDESALYKKLSHASVTVISTTSEKYENIIAGKYAPEESDNENTFIELLKFIFLKKDNSFSDEGLFSQGSGFILKDYENTIATSYHVVDEYLEDGVFFCIRNGQKTINEIISVYEPRTFLENFSEHQKFLCRIKLIDHSKDLALLEMVSPDQKNIQKDGLIISYERPPITSKVYNVSTPFGHTGQWSTGVVNNWITGYQDQIAGINEDFTINEFILVNSTSIFSGSSGSALTNEKGEIIGMVTASYQDMGMAIITPINELFPRDEESMLLTITSN